MPMCSECGAHVEDNVLACVICGSNLTVPADNAVDTLTSTAKVAAAEVQSEIAEDPAVDLRVTAAVPVQVDADGETESSKSTPNAENDTDDPSIDLVYSGDDLDLEWLTDPDEFESIPESNVANQAEATTLESTVDAAESEPVMTNAEGSAATEFVGMEPVPASEPVTSEAEPVVAETTVQGDNRLAPACAVPEPQSAESEQPAEELVAPEPSVPTEEAQNPEPTEALELPGLDALREVVSTAESGSATMTSNFGTEVVSVSDGHMGKGLIKPQVVAVESDGYHFRYDEPKASVIKMEQTSEQAVEFRVTGEQMEKLKAEQTSTEVEASVDVQSETEQPLAEELLVDAAISVQTAETTEVADVATIGDTIIEPLVDSDALMEAPPEPLPQAPAGEIGPELEIELEVELVEELEPENEMPLPEPELILEPEQTPEPLPVMLWDAKPKFEITSKNVAVFGHYGQVAERLDLSQVRRVALERSFWGMLFGVSTLKFYTANPAEPALVIKGVKRAGEIRALIDNYL